ncbi:MAG: DNA gyrase C-terminal beta-propeller domain-containing protein, partial [Lentisphaerota bacterium]
GAHSVHDHDAIMLITSGGQMIRMPVSDIRSISRNTQGVKLIDLAEGDKLISATTVEPEDDVTQEEKPVVPSLENASPEIAEEKPQPDAT